MVTRCISDIVKLLKLLKHEGVLKIFIKPEIITKTIEKLVGDHFLVGTEERDIEDYIEVKTDE